LIHPVHLQAISFGKGRDVGFNTILDFEAKISRGNGEVIGMLESTS
jgi:hypothetical protein